MTTPSIHASFEALKKLADKESVDSLNPPATVAEIKELEKELGFSLPAAYLALLKIHNGSTGTKANGFSEFNIGFAAFSSIEDVLLSKNGNDEAADDTDEKPGTPAKGIKPGWTNPHWIPIFSTGAGNYVCIDLDPGPGGKKGQLIYYNHEGAEHELVADSLEDYLNEKVQKAQRELEAKEKKSKEPAKDAKGKPWWTKW